MPKWALRKVLNYLSKYDSPPPLYRYRQEDGDWGPEGYLCEVATSEKGYWSRK